MKIFQKYRRRWTTLSLIFLFSLVLLIYFPNVLFDSENRHCYRIKTENTLPDIANYHPNKGKSIFFHETSCTSYTKGKIFIKSRQACAVESAARLNPESEVYLLYTSPVNFLFEGDESDRFLQVLLNYSNVRILYLNYENYTKGSPIEDLYSSGKIEHSLHIVAHISDVLRYLTLWKYGGVYLDLDVIVMKPLKDLKINYAGIESTSVVASGVLNFDATGDGHKYVEKCLLDLKTGFDGKEWSKNGPGIITRLLHSLCGSNTTDDMINSDCSGFTAYPPNVFYPVPWQKWQMYFEEESLDAVINATSNSFAIHAWNKLSEKTKIPLHSKAPYLYFAKKYCPNIVNECDEVF